MSGTHRTSDLIDAIRTAADKFERDGSSRGDLKLVSRSLRELRYALKVFAPYRHKRKVTVFGSARTQADHPAYTQAVDFGAQIAQRNWMVITGAAAGIMEAGHEGAGRPEWVLIAPVPADGQGKRDLSASRSCKRPRRYG